VVIRDAVVELALEAIERTVPRAGSVKEKLEEQLVESRVCVASAISRVVEGGGVDR